MANRPMVLWHTVMVGALIAAYLAFDNYLGGRTSQALLCGALAVIGIAIVPHRILGVRIAFNRNQDRLTFRRRFLWFNPAQTHAISQLARVEVDQSDPANPLVLFFLDQDAPVYLPTYATAKEAEAVATAINDWLMLDRHPSAA